MPNGKFMEAIEVAFWIVVFSGVTLCMIALVVITFWPSILNNFVQQQP